MDDLPNELLLHIVEQLRGPTSWSEPADYGRMHALAALCCVSKKLYCIAKPLLYESIDLPSSGITFPQSQRLWGRLQEQPRLRLDVKILRQKTRANLKYDTFRRLHVRDEYRKDIISVLRRAGLDFEDAHILLERFLWHEDLFFALVAFETPNLERLWIRPSPYTDGFDEGCTLLEGIGRMAMGVPWLNTHHFENLKTLYIDLISTPEMFTRYALPLLLLPRLEELTLGSWGATINTTTDLYEILFDYDDDDSAVFGCPWVWPVRSSSITKLSLLRPCVSEKMVEKMILACKALKSFECIHPTRSNWNDEWFGHLVPALEHHSESLEDLSTTCTMHRSGLKFTGMAQLDPLCGLTNLKSSRISLHLVSDPDRWQNAQFLPAFFPPSLTSLHIHFPREPDARACQHLLDILTGYKEGHIPSLQEVRITWVYFQDEGDKYDVLEERLRSLLGIKEQFEILSVKFDIFFTIRDDRCKSSYTKESLRTTDIPQGPISTGLS
jgi:hypothetical protein